MKYLPSVLVALLATREMRTSVGSLLRYLAFLGGAIFLFAVIFHVIMEREGQSHSWLTGLYWVLVVMTTLGFGDITFESDLGRVFTIVVLSSGVVLLLIMLPFQFVRLFYAPWIEARLRSRTPRTVPAGLSGHVIIASNDPIVPGLVKRLDAVSHRYVLLESDPVEANRLLEEGISVVTGRRDSAETYRAIGADRAYMVVANAGDIVNTNIILTVREVSETVPITAIVEEDDSIDVLELSGATHVLPLKRQLGEALASRVHIQPGAHIVGSYKHLSIAELPAAEGGLVGLEVKDTHLRDRHDVNIVGVWSSGQLRQVFPETVVRESDVVVVTGTVEALESIDRRLPRAPRADRPVLVIGAGRVGGAAAAHLRRQGVRTHVLDRDEGQRARLLGIADEVLIGDAADRAVIERAGIAEASSVVLTTNDDAMNIYLAVYCRRLNPSLRIVSRVTDEQNVEAIHRAGADFALSYSSLGAQSIFSRLRGHELVTIGEGVDLFTRPVPPSLASMTLNDSLIGTRTGLCIVGLETKEGLISSMHRETVLPADALLVMLGTVEQRRAFTREFGAPPPPPGAARSR